MFRIVFTVRIQLNLPSLLLSFLWNIQISKYVTCTHKAYYISHFPVTLTKYQIQFKKERFTFLLGAVHSRLAPRQKWQKAWQEGIAEGCYSAHGRQARSREKGMEPGTRICHSKSYPSEPPPPSPTS